MMPLLFSFLTMGGAGYYFKNKKHNISNGSMLSFWGVQLILFSLGCGIGMSAGSYIKINSDDIFLNSKYKPAFEEVILDSAITNFNLSNYVLIKTVDRDMYRLGVPLDSRKKILVKLLRASNSTDVITLRELMKMLDSKDVPVIAHEPSIMRPS